MDVDCWKGQRRGIPGVCHKQEEGSISEHAVGYACTMIMEQRSDRLVWEGVTEEEERISVE